MVAGRLENHSPPVDRPPAFWPSGLRSPAGPAGIPDLIHQFPGSGNLYGEFLLFGQPFFRKHPGRLSKAMLRSMIGPAGGDPNTADIHRSSHRSRSCGHKGPTSSGITCRPDTPGRVAKENASPPQVQPQSPPNPAEFHHEIVQQVTQSI